MFILLCVYHINVPSPDEEDVSHDDQTEQLVEPLGAPIVNPGGGVGHRDADNAWCSKTNIISSYREVLKNISSFKTPFKLEKRFSNLLST